MNHFCTENYRHILKKQSKTFSRTIMKSKIHVRVSTRGIFLIAESFNLEVLIKGCCCFFRFLGLFVLFVCFLFFFWGGGLILIALNLPSRHYGEF